MEERTFPDHEHIPSADNKTFEGGHSSSLQHRVNSCRCWHPECFATQHQQDLRSPISDYSGSVDEEEEEDEPVFEDCVETFRELKEEPVSCWPFFIFN
jgi:hypothetical protein